MFVLEPRKATDARMTAFARVYDVHNRSDRTETRGGHRYPLMGKQTVLRCLLGSMRVELHHPEKCGVVTLDDPIDALVIHADVWHKVELGAGAIMLSCATTEFTPGETITTRLPCKHGDACIL